MTRIFIVEDEAVVALELKDRLRELGYEVCGHAMTGEEALAMIGAAAPDLVILDVNLGSGMSGTDVATALRPQLDVPVIFLTAYVDSQITGKAALTGSSAYLTKPFDPYVLRANIELALVRHEATLALQASEIRFRRVVDHISDALLSIDADERVTFANDRFFDLFAMSRDEIVSLRSDDYVCPPWRDRFRAWLARRAAGEAAQAHFEFEALRRDGGTFWAEVRVVSLVDSAGAIVGTQWALRDVTERREAESALTLSQQHFRGLLAASPVGVFETDSGGAWVFVNETWSSITGLSMERARGEGWMGALHPDDRQAVLEEWQSATQAGRTFRLEYRFVPAAGRVVWVLGQAVPLRGSGVSGGYIGTITDITPLKIAETEIARREEFLRLSQEVAHIGSWDWDLLSGSLYWSDEMCRLHGRDAADWSPALAEALAAYPSGDRECVERGNEAARQHPGAGEGEFDVRLPDGSTRTHWVSWNTVSDATGRPLRMIGANLDITDRKRAEEALRRSRFIIEQAQDALLLVNVHGELVDVNEAACRLLCWPRESLCGQTIWGLVEGFASHEWASFVERLERHGARVMEVAFRPRHGDPIAVDLTVSHLVFDGADYVCVFARDIRERKKAEARLRDSEERYRRLFDEASVGIYVAGLDGVLLDVNPAFGRLVGHEVSDLIGTNIRQLHAEPALPSESMGVHEAEWRRKGGERLLVAVRSVTLHDERGMPSYCQGFVQDVSLSRQYDAALRLLSTELSHLPGEEFFAEVTRYLASLTDADVGFIGIHVAGPPPRVRTLGFVVDGAVLSRIEYPLDGTPCGRVVQWGVPLSIEGGVQLMFPGDAGLQRFGAEGYIAVPLTDACGTVVGAMGIMTRHRIAHVEHVQAIVTLFAMRVSGELERRRAEERFASVFAFAPDALLIVNETGRILFANRLVEETLGYSLDELTTMGVDQLLPGHERARHVEHRRAFAADPKARRMSSSRSRFWALRKDGVTVPVEISLSPFESSDGRLVVAAIRDISDRVHMEEEKSRIDEQLRQVQRIESIGTLASGIAHDFNNLLSVIHASLELARGELATISPVRPMLDDISTAATRATAMVKQILAFSRQQGSVRTVSSPHVILDETFRLLRATLPASISIRMTMAPRVPHALMDATQIHQVLMNLGTNAWQAIDGTTGTVELCLDAVDVDEHAVAALPAGMYVRFQVFDTGSGMDSTTLARIFEPFFTTKGVGRGTGLGLATAHGIVAGHGGAITVRSTVGAGSVFTVYLPARDGPETIADESAVVTPPASTGRVLLIEDEVLILRLTTRLMQNGGFEVVAFNKAAEALRWLSANRGSVDVVVTDLNMPGLSGLAVGEAVAGIQPGLPVVLISGNSPYSEEVLSRSNIARRLDKPFSGAKLAEVLHDVLSRSAGPT